MIHRFEYFTRRVIAFGYLGIFALLSACAGQHVRPPGAYATAEPGVVRFAFDQEGDVYPRDTTRIDWTHWEPSWWQRNFGGPFRLRSLEPESHNPPYSPTLREQAERDAIEALTHVVENADTLVVLIRGFNVPFADAERSFKKLRARINPQDGSRIAFVEVYWDGLVTQSGEGLDKAAVASFWPDSLTYSNLAGQCGLRKLLASIDRPVRLRFVTHSRGAAVALATLANPLYDTENGIEVPCGLNYPPLPGKMFKDVKIAAFAPAIGNGHLTGNTDSQLASHSKSVKLFIGVNERDVATSKLFLPARVYGDTRLGSDLNYGKAEASMTRANLKLAAFAFAHGSDHSIDAYLDEDPKLAACMFTVIDLGAANAAECTKLINFGGL